MLAERRRLGAEVAREPALEAAEGLLTQCLIVVDQERDMVPMTDAVMAARTRSLLHSTAGPSTRLATVAAAAEAWRQPRSVSGGWTV